MLPKSKFQNSTGKSQFLIK